MKVSLYFTTHKRQSLSLTHFKLFSNKEHIMYLANKTSNLKISILGYAHKTDLDWLDIEVDGSIPGRKWKRRRWQKLCINQQN